MKVKVKVKVTRQDIRNGRDNAGFTCGCPIHYALGRKLKVPIDPDRPYLNVLLVKKYDEARLGNIRIHLPSEAVKFQKMLADDANANVEPFEFLTELRVPE